VPIAGPWKRPATDGLEQRFHLTRQAREDEDVPEHEPRGSPQGIVQRLRTGGQTGPARCVVSETARPETLAQRGRHRSDLLAIDVESRRDSLARDVVWRAAEPSRDEDELDARPLGSQKGGDLGDVVPDSGHERHLDAEPGEPAGQPGGVRVLDVPRDDLVADGQDGRRALRALHRREYR
jgi:hypothetical protein